MPTFVIDENAPILVEFTPQPGFEEVSLAARGVEDVAEKSRKALDSAMNTIHHMAERLKTTINALSERPTQVEVEFSLKFDAAVGAVVSKAGTEAGFSVKLIWERKTDGR